MKLSWDEDDGAVRDLLLAARAHDGRPEVESGGPLPREFRDGEHLLAWDDGTLVGYAHLNTDGDAFGHQVVEAIAHPDHRGRGVGSALVDEVLAHTAGRPLRLWSHGDHPAAARIAETRNLARVRELWKMHLVGDAPLPEPRFAEGVRLRTFVPGQDEAAMVEVNGKAFDWHPEQSQLSVEELRDTEQEAWFDPAGFFLAVDDADRVLGFHWTKVHAGDPPVGEVYVVGVDPAAQGGGLGKALTLAGLHHLRDRGLRETILYVESDNSPAVAVYTRLGFTLMDTDVAYQR